MPYKDATRRREYDKTYKRRQRLQGLTKKGFDNRLTESEVETAEDLHDKLNEIWDETKAADSHSLKLETKLRIQLRIIEIGLRMIEITDHERRIVALEENGNESSQITN